MRIARIIQQIWSKRSGKLIIGVMVIFCGLIVYTSIKSHQRFEAWKNFDGKYASVPMTEIIIKNNVTPPTNDVKLRIPTDFFDNYSLHATQKAIQNSTNPTVEIQLDFQKKYAVLGDSSTYFFVPWFDGKSWSKDNVAESPYAQKRRLEFWPLNTKENFFSSLDDLATAVFKTAGDGKYDGILKAGDEFHRFWEKEGFFEYLVPILDRETASQFVKCTRYDIAKYRCDQTKHFAFTDGKFVLDGKAYEQDTKHGAVMFFPLTMHMILLKCDSFRAIGADHKDNTPCFLMANYQNLFHYELLFPRNQLYRWQIIQREAEQLLSTFLVDKSYSEKSAGNRFTVKED